MNNEKKDAFAAYHINIWAWLVQVLHWVIGMIPFWMDNKCVWHIEVLLYNCWVILAL